MEVTLLRSLEALLFPPSGLLLLMLAGLLLRPRKPAVAALLVWGSLVAITGLSLPVTAQYLMRQLETAPVLDANSLPADGAQAIVILGAGRYAVAPEYQGDTVSRLALERLRYGARLHRRTGLPIIVSGGDPSELGATPEAVLMQKALAEDFQITAVETETQSRTSGENARFTKALLDAKGIHTIYLVSHAWHMPRALRSFEKAGIKVLPAPMGFTSIVAPDTPEILRWLPNAQALGTTAMALHEMIGMVWYRVRY